MTTTGAEGAQPLPFDLPAAFLAQLGYGGAAGPMNMPEAARARLRSADVDEPESAPAEGVLRAQQPRRWVALYWEPASDELTWDDGQDSGAGAGQLDPWLWLAFMHDPGSGQGTIFAWLSDHAANLGSSEEPATHWLVVDRTENRAYVAPVAVARAIVRTQDLTDGP
jgi:hypothetical protein